MTEVVIIEDERLIAERLKSLINTCDEEISITAMLASVSQAKEWFRANSPPDLIFLDIQLSDGNCFEFLKSIQHSPPVIFTTAFDEYAIKAFKYNSIDYLLKPIDKTALQQAISKYKRLEGEGLNPHSTSFEHVSRVVQQDFKKRFLVKLGDQYQNIDTSQISFFQYENGTPFLVCETGRKLPIDYSLDQLETMLNPIDFFRINRQFLINIGAIKQINSYFNSRLLLSLEPAAEQQVIVSRDRVPDFKKWMDC